MPLLNCMLYISVMTAMQKLLMEMEGNCYLPVHIYFNGTASSWHLARDV